MTFPELLRYIIKPEKYIQTKCEHYCEHTFTFENNICLWAYCLMFLGQMLGLFDNFSVSFSILQAYSAHSSTVSKTWHLRYPRCNSTDKSLEFWGWDDEWATRGLVISLLSWLQRERATKRLMQLFSHMHWYLPRCIKCMQCPLIIRFETLRAGSFPWNYCMTATSSPNYLSNRLGLLLLRFFFFSKKTQSKNSNQWRNGGKYLTHNNITKQYMYIQSFSPSNDTV